MRLKYIVYTAIIIVLALLMLCWLLPDKKDLIRIDIDEISQPVDTDFTEEEPDFVEKITEKREEKEPALTTDIDFGRPTSMPDRRLAATYAVNSLNQSMGQPDLYPLVLTPVIATVGDCHDDSRA